MFFGFIRASQVSLLRVEGLFCQYGSQPIIDDVSFAVESGEIFALLGPNGAGKSTTFRVLAGLEHKYKGSIFFAEQALVGPLWKRARLGLGYLPQKSVALWKLTVAENVLIPLRQKGENNPQGLLTQVGLSKHLHRKACELSGGEIRRLELARCLALQPRLMILDEPFAALDPLAVEQFSAILQKLRDQGMTIVF